MIKEEFVERMIEADKIISEQLNKCAEERDENRKTWAIIEKELTKLVGNKRTQAYDLYKFHSLNYIPMGIQFINKLINEMSPIERNMVN